MTWTEQTLKELIGREESIRLEFKSGRLFDDPNRDVATPLSKEISAFSNTEGGCLILGMAETQRHRITVASHLDGVQAKQWPSHKLQQVIESNIHPPLIGLRVHRVSLSEFSGERVAFVIEVPQSHTAHQAKDRLYYGRSEYEAKPLHDIDIRLRMQRGSAPQALITAPVRLHRAAISVVKELIDQHRDTLTDIAKAFQDQGVDIQSPDAPLDPKIRDAIHALGADKPHLIDTASLTANRYPCDEYECRFLLRNVGERTIHDFEVHIEITSAVGYGASTDSKLQPPGGFFGPQHLADNCRRVEIHGAMASFLRAPTPTKVFPGSELPLGSAYAFVPSAQLIPPDSLTATWRVFLDDVYPRSGTIDIGSEIVRISHDR